MIERLFTLVDRQTETPTVLTLRLRAVDGQPFAFFPGAFGMVTLPDSKLPARAFSFASAPHDDLLDLTIERTGAVSSALHALPIGSEIAIRGPLGRFRLPDPIDRDVLMIAGGTGIAPLRSMLRHLAVHRPGQNVRLVYSVQRPQDIIYRAELELLAKEWANFQQTITITRPDPSTDWSGRNGRVSLVLFSTFGPSLVEHIPILCGPPAFVFDCIRMLVELGVPRDRILTEQWLQPNSE